MKKFWDKSIARCKKIPIVGKYWEAWVYVFFGGLTTVVNFAVYTLFAKGLFPLLEITSFFGLASSDTIANAIAWLVAVVFAFFVNGRFVFKSETQGARAVIKFGQFFSMRAISGAFEILAFPFFNRVMNDYIAKLLIAFLVIALNYIFSKIWIFRKNPEIAETAETNPDSTNKTDTKDSTNKNDKVDSKSKGDQER